MTTGRIEMIAIGDQQIRNIKSYPCIPMLSINTEFKFQKKDRSG